MYLACLLLPFFPFFLSRHDVHLCNAFFIFIFYIFFCRHSRLCATWMDSLLPISRQSGHRLEFGDFTLRHGLRRHSLRAGRADLLCRSQVPNPTDPRVSGSDSELPAIETGRSDFVGGDFASSVDVDSIGVGQNDSGEQQFDHQFSAEQCSVFIFVCVFVFVSRSDSVFVSERKSHDAAATPANQQEQNDAAFASAFEFMTTLLRKIVLYGSWCKKKMLTFLYTYKTKTLVSCLQYQRQIASHFLSPPSKCRSARKIHWIFPLFSESGIIIKEDKSRRNFSSFFSA